VECVTKPEAAEETKEVYALRWKDSEHKYVTVIYKVVRVTRNGWIKLKCNAPGKVKNVRGASDGYFETIQGAWANKLEYLSVRMNSSWVGGDERGRCRELFYSVLSDMWNEAFDFGKLFTLCEEACEGEKDRGRGAAQE